ASATSSTPSRSSTRSGWTVRTAPSARRLLWTKAAFNAALNPIGALALKTNGELAKSAGLRELLGAASREAFSLMRAQGIEPLTRRPERTLLAGCRRAPDQVNSMAQDLAFRRRTEARDILGPFVRAARRTGREAPVLSMLLRILERVEKELGRSSR
ncbi:MAG: ketopantoate reductase C-terminal domain-containing protein, partial [Elusimicrobiota bacterium]